MKSWLQKFGLLIALVVMATMIVVPIVVWWVKAVRKPRDKS